VSAPTTDHHSAAPDSTAPSQSIGWPRRFLQWLVFFAVWLLLSGKSDPFYLSAGGLTAALVVWLNSRMPPLEAGKVTLVPIRLIPWLSYYAWLLGQMILSAVYVAKVVISPQGRLKPRLVRFRCQEPNIVAAVTLANSITLTPGTLTIRVEDGDTYLVHALSEQTAKDLLTGKMQAHVARVFGERDAPAVTELPLEEDQA